MTWAGAERLIGFLAKDFVAGASDTGMIYQRRALQRRLNELRILLKDDAVNRLAERLNRAGKDRVAAMWEVLVLHGLSQCGMLQNELPLQSGRKPDIHFKQGALSFTADVTAVSDEGLDNDNPYRELHDLIERAKQKLGLPIGGMNLHVQSRRDRTKRGTRTALMLPSRKQLQQFVQQAIVPQLREKISSGEKVLRIAIDDGDVALTITIDPARSPYNSGSFAAYDVPQIKDRNPLYGALKAKADQLRGANGVTGVIVGDGDCVALSGRSAHFSQVSAKEIIAEFFRQYSSIDFVLLLSVRETHGGWTRMLPPTRQNNATLLVRDGCGERAALNELFRTMVEYFPRPAMMPVNGALRAREDGYYLGHHGGYALSGSTVRLSLREFTEIFAGLRTLQDNGAQYVASARKLAQEPNRLQSVVLQNLKEGRLPVSIDIIRTDENENDDWVEMRFGDFDPAIAPLR